MSVYEEGKSSVYSDLLMQKSSQKDKPKCRRFSLFAPTSLSIPIL